MTNNILTPEIRFTSTSATAEIDLRYALRYSAIHLAVVIPMILILIPRAGAAAAAWYLILFALAATLALLSYLQERVADYHQAVNNLDGQSGYRPDVPAVVHYLYQHPLREYDLISLGSRALGWTYKLLLLAGAYALALEVVPSSTAFQLGAVAMMLAAVVVTQPLFKRLAAALIFAALIGASGLIPNALFPAPPAIEQIGMLRLAVLLWLAYSLATIVRMSPGIQVTLQAQDGSGPRQGKLGGLDAEQIVAKPSGIHYLFDAVINGRVHGYLHFAGMRRKARDTVQLYPLADMIKEAGTGMWKPKPGTHARGQRAVSPAELQRHLDAQEH